MSHNLGPLPVEADILQSIPSCSTESANSGKAVVRKIKLALWLRCSDHRRHEIATARARLKMYEQQLVPKMI